MIISWNLFLQMVSVEHMIALICLTLEYSESCKTNIISSEPGLFMGQWCGLMNRIFVLTHSTLNPKKKVSNQGMQPIASRAG